jgi:drug/metabolite transporter (DMT)-like permease
MLAIPLALLAAFLFAVGTVCMQKGTLEMPEGESEKPGFLLKLIRKPIWVAGIVIDFLGYGAQAVALAVGRLVVVQPLLVTTVVFALPLGVKFTGQRVGRREILGAALVVGGLAIFVILNNPDEGRSDAPLGSWVITAAIFLALAAALIVGSRGRSAGVRAALLGTAAGGLLGVTGGLTKATVTRFDDGIGAVFGDWHVYALVALELLAFSLLQSALATGALAPAIATNMSVETLVSIGLGVILFKEDLRGSPALLAVSLVALVVALVGLVLLARSEGRAHVPPAPEAALGAA